MGSATRSRQSRGVKLARSGRRGRSTGADVGEPTACPLAWPEGWRRTPAADRKRGNFSTRSQRPGRSYATTQDVSIAQAVDRVLDECSRYTRFGQSWRIDPQAVVISTNLELPRDGLPRSNQREPADVGAAVYFQLDGKPQAIACDRYLYIAQNIAAIAATLAALRALERHGTGMMERAFTGFAALPPPSAGSEPWHVVLQVNPTAEHDVVRKAYMRLRSQNHPDKGGDATQFDRVQRAWERYEVQR